MGDLVHDTSHQLPGADPSTVRPGDRIVLRFPYGSVAIAVRSTHLSASTSGDTYVSGYVLDAAGQPLTGEPAGQTLTGPAGGPVWDWYRGVESS